MLTVPTFVFVLFFSLPSALPFPPHSDSLARIGWGGARSRRTRGQRTGALDGAPSGLQLTSVRFPAGPRRTLPSASSLRLIARSIHSRPNPWRLFAFGTLLPSLFGRRPFFRTRSAFTALERTRKTFPGPPLGVALARHATSRCSLFAEFETSGSLPWALVVFSCRPRPSRVRCLRFSLSLRLSASPPLPLPPRVHWAFVSSALSSTSSMRLLQLPRRRPPSGTLPPSAHPLRPLPAGPIPLT